MRDLGLGEESQRGWKLGPKLGEKGSGPPDFGEEAHMWSCTSKGKWVGLRGNSGWAYELRNGPLGLNWVGLKLKEVGPEFSSSKGLKEKVKFK